MSSSEIIEETGIPAEEARLGAAIRERRQAAGLSLAALAAATGLTKGYLSKVERGAGQPSIGTVFRIAEALGLTAGALLAGSLPSSGGTEVVRAATAAVPRGEELFLRPLFAGAGSRLIAMELWPPIEGRPASASSTHAGEEMLHVLAGTVELAFEDETLVLHAGDSARFDARRPHRTRSLGPSRARALLVLAV